MNSNHKEKINQFINLIYENNRKFNLTGFKNIEDITNKLVNDSVIDLSLICVPRGTLVADMGTGSGVPGVVLAILNSEAQFVLLDSNQKKCAFIKDVCSELKIDNVTVNAVRIEEYARDHRNTFDVVVSRAFAPVLCNMELGLPMLKKNGVLYIYSHYLYDSLSAQLREFCSLLGGEGIETPYREGVTVKKTAETPLLYPRNYPVIKRESRLIPEI